MPAKIGLRNGLTRLAFKTFQIFGENFEIVKNELIFNPFYNERVMCIRLRVAPTNPPRSHFALKKAKYTVDFHF